MSDYQQDPESYGPNGIPNYGDEIDLDFGGVDAIRGGIPISNGVYVFEVTKAGIVGTQDGKGRMVRVENVIRERIDGGRHEKAMDGQPYTENWFLPDRVNQTPEQYTSTRGFLRGKIEAVTAQTWDQDGMKLNVRQLVGCRYKALVINVDDGKGYGPQPRIQRHMRMDEDHSQITVPTGVRTKGAAQGGAPQANGGVAPGQQPAPAGRFRI